MNSVMSAQNLSKVLQRENLGTWKSRAELQEELHCLKELGAAPLDWFVEGFPVRGWDLKVTVAESKLGGLGDACLFSAVLGAFLDDRASINTVHRLTLSARESNRRFRSPVRIGRKAVL